MTYCQANCGLCPACKQKAAMGSPNPVLTPLAYVPHSRPIHGTKSAKWRKARQPKEIVNKQYFSK